MQETRKYTVVDLFAGVGGLSYGFSRNEHYEIILANEMQKDIAKAYTLNHPAVNMLQGDIKDLSEDILRQAIGNQTVDVVVGGPPCQSYSTLGKRQMDARANLFMEYKRVLCILHPRAFLFENVKGILSMDKGALFEDVRKEFEDIGYSLQYKILNAVDYGVPQLRERVILVGFLGENPFQYPEPTHGEGLLPYVTLQDALKDLPAANRRVFSFFGHFFALPKMYLIREHIAFIVVFNTTSWYNASIKTSKTFRIIEDISGACL